MSVCIVKMLSEVVLLWLLRTIGRYSKAIIAPLGNGNVKPASVPATSSEPIPDSHSYGKLNAERGIRIRPRSVTNRIIHFFLWSPSELAASSNNGAGFTSSCSADADSYEVVPMKGFSANETKHFPELNCSFDYCPCESIS